MDNIGTIVVALLAALLVGLIIYRVARRSGSSDNTLGGYTKPGKPNPDKDYR